MRKGARNATAVDFQSVDMSIYTKTGDDGTTSLYGGKRVAKSDPQVIAYGTVDELSSFIGVLLTMLTHTSHIVLLTTIQKDLHTLSAYLAGKKTNLAFLKKRVQLFEQTIDETQKKLPPLHSFILPQGTQLTSWFHVVRAVCRRAERAIVAIHNKEKAYTQIIVYVNRLSDLFFVLGRVYNTRKEITI